LLLLFEHADVEILLLLGLEAAVTEVGRGVDELELDLLERVAERLRVQRLAERDDALDVAWHAALEHDKVVVDDAIVDEAAERGDLLVGEIELGGGVARVGAVADLEDLLVALDAMMVAVLTGARHRVADVGRMPRANARNLAQTAMRLARQTSRAPARRHARVSVTLGRRDHVDHLVLVEHAADRHLLLQLAECPVDLLRHAAAVHLNL
jgi:hypothetical protein